MGAEEPKPPAPAPAPQPSASAPKKAPTAPVVAAPPFAPSVEPKGKAPGASAARPNVFYFITLALSLAVAATPFILAWITTGAFPDVGLMDGLAAAAAGVLFWTAALLGLVKSIRIFGCIGGGVIAASLGTPLLGLFLWNKSSGQTPSSWIAMASFALIFAGTSLVLWFFLGVVSGAIDKSLRKHRFAMALDFFLGAGLGLALIMALSIVYSIALPDMSYTRFWKSKAEEVQKKADELRRK